MPDLGKDCDAALRFVIEHINREADRTGSPLDENDTELLENMPIKPTNPTLQGDSFAYEGNLPMPVLRDFQYERLCTLAKNAHKHDVAVRPEAIQQWVFAAAVLRFHRHPMGWLLEWAGIKVKKAKTPFDGCLLWATGLTVVISLITVVALVLIFSPRQGQLLKFSLWIGGGCLGGGVVACSYFLARRLESWQGEQTIEKYRCDLTIPGSQRGT
jgi:hypothetical protein